MTKFLNAFNAFRVPTARELAQRELEEAQRLLLEYSTAQEYATAMVRCSEERIARLQNYLKG